MKPLITVDELRRLMPLLSLAKAGAFVSHLEAAMLEQAITSKPRRCGFLSNLAHESTHLTKWAEDLNYSADRLMVVFPYHFKNRTLALQYAHKPQLIANRVYANKIGNGNEATGDGWLFRGRGPIGLTGRANYRRFGELLGVDLEGDPNQATRNDLGFRIAALFWKLGGCNELADKLTLKGDAADRGVLTQICRRINGGTNGLSDRLNFFRAAKQVLHGDDAPEGHTPTPAPAAPPVALDAVAVAEQEAAEKEDQEDLFALAAKSEKVKSAGMGIGARVAKHAVAAVTGFEALDHARQLGTIFVILVLLAVAIWLIYHNRNKLRPLLAKVLK